MTETHRRPRKQGLEHFLKVVRELPDPGPRLLWKQLEEHGYRGQEQARRALCLMAYRHVRRVKRIYLEGADRNELPRKTNYLLAGPTGSGKTFLVETLFGKLLRLPTTMVDITTFSETGYVGQDPISILTRLLHTAEGNPPAPPRTSPAWACSASCSRCSRPATWSCRPSWATPATPIT